MSSPYLRPLVRGRAAQVDETFYAARQAYRYTQDFFRHNARGIQYRRVLGFGSSGIVTLWSVLNNMRQFVRDVAVKAPIDEGDPYFRMELNWMSETFWRAEHFVQLVELPGGNIDASLYNDPDAENGSPAIIIMEYFERCELNELLVRLNEAVSSNPHVPDNEKTLEYIPSRILWRLFLCLVRMCIGMAYPPQQDYDGPERYTEEIRPADDLTPIVHFDMHPLNVFIDDPRSSRDGGQEHGYAPRFKLGDFGLTTEWDDGWDDEAKIAQANVGKPGYQAPEQRDRQRPLEDGAFGSHTNVWGAGLLMYNALTLYFTDDEDWQPQVCQVMMPNGQSRAVSTWAPFLVGNQVYDDFRAYSVELRSLVARCMADNRRDRPSLDELLNVIQRNIRRGDLDAEEAKNRWEEEKAADPDKQKPPVDIKRPPRVEDDALLLRFFREYIRDPPRRDDPYEDLWDQ